MGLTIRHARKEDLQSVQLVAKTSWNATYEGIIPSDIQNNFLKMAYSDEMMDRRLQHTLLLVA